MESDINPDLPLTFALQADKFTLTILHGSLTDQLASLPDVRDSIIAQGYISEEKAVLAENLTRQALQLILSQLEKQFPIVISNWDQIDKTMEEVIKENNAGS